MRFLTTDGGSDVLVGDDIWYGMSRSILPVLIAYSVMAEARTSDLWFEYLVLT